MKDEKRVELQQNVNERYKSYSSDLKKEFAAKLELLKQKYKVLTDSERENLINKLKQNQSNWREISNLLAEDKKQVIKRNEEIRVLQSEYSKAVENLKTRKAMELKHIDTQYQHDNIVEYRDEHMQQLKSEYSEEINKIDSLIQANVQKAKKCQGYIASKKDAFEKAKEKIEEKYNQKFKQICEKHKDDKDFAKPRIIIPKELLNVSDDNFSILEEDLDKCKVKSKKDIAFDMCKDKKNEEIKKIYEEYKKDVEEKIEQLNKINEEIQDSKKSKQQIHKKYDEKVKSLLGEVSKMATEKGVGKIEKYSTNPRANTSAKSNINVEKTKNTVASFIKNSSIYKKITEGLNKKREEKLKRVATESIALNNRGLESADKFFTNLHSEVEENPTYVNRENSNTKTKEIVK